MQTKHIMTHKFSFMWAIGYKVRYNGRILCTERSAVYYMKSTTYIMHTTFIFKYKHSLSLSVWNLQGYHHRSVCFLKKHHKLIPIPMYNDRFHIERNKMLLCGNRDIQTASRMCTDMDRALMIESSQLYDSILNVTIFGDSCSCFLQIQIGFMLCVIIH